MNDVHTRTQTELSAVIATKDLNDAPSVLQLVGEYQQQLDKLGRSYELIIVVDGRNRLLVEEVRPLPEHDDRLRVIVLGKWPGDATALSVAFEHVSSATILTLPAYHQVAPEALPTLVESLEESDMVVVRRWPRTDSWFKRLQTRAFSFFLRSSLGMPFHDLGCGVRILRKKVTDVVYVYGDQQRFLPVLADQYGYKVKEIDLPQASKTAGAPRHVFPFGSYVRRLLDLLSIFFLVNYTIRPLRFFGLTGLFTFLVGAAFTLYLAIQRLYMNETLADRPALLLGLLFMVLGIQLFAIGLVGELIIYIHARNLKAYTIERTIGFDAVPEVETVEKG